MVTSKYYPTVEAIEKASGVLEEILEPTPFQKNQNLSDIYGADVYLKREDLQMVRSYKIRGAYNKIRSIEPKSMKNGIVCASAGNHAQGVALSAKKLGIKATIVMPETTPEIKVNAVKAYGAGIVLHGDGYSDAAEEAQRLVKERKLTFIHIKFYVLRINSTTDEYNISYIRFFYFT